MEYLACSSGVSAVITDEAEHCDLLENSTPLDSELIEDDIVRVSNQNINGNKK